MRCIVGVVSACLAVTTANAQGTSANDVMPGCEAGILFATSKTSKGADEAVGMAYCLGAVVSIIGTGPILKPEFQFCLPDTGTVDQAIRVVVSYVNGIPQRRHEPFLVLALEAFRKAWPC